jgi:hypothetical protein
LFAKQSPKGDFPRIARGRKSPLESVLKISDRDPKGFAGKQQSIARRLAAQLVNPLRQKNL